MGDHEAKEGLIRQSHLNWTIVRAPRLTNGRRTGTYRSGEDIGANSIIPAISRADVAEFMLKQVTDDTYLRKAPAVTYLEAVLWVSTAAGRELKNAWTKELSVGLPGWEADLCAHRGLPPTRSAGYRLGWAHDRAAPLIGPAVARAQRRSTSRPWFR